MLFFISLKPKAMKAIKIKETDLYFGSPMMVDTGRGFVPNYTNKKSLAAMINEEDKDIIFSELPIKDEFLELI